MLNIVGLILEFNQLNQSDECLKCLAQLKTGNNSEKLKNETRQLLYSLYRLKKLTKQLYKNLVDII